MKTYIDMPRKDEVVMTTTVHRGEVTSDILNNPNAIVNIRYNEPQLVNCDINVYKITELLLSKNYSKGNITTNADCKISSSSVTWFDPDINNIITTEYNEKSTNKVHTRDGNITCGGRLVINGTLYCPSITAKNTSVILDNTLYSREIVCDSLDCRSSLNVDNIRCNSIYIDKSGDACQFVMFKSLKAKQVERIDANTLYHFSNNIVTDRVNCSVSRISELPTKRVHTRTNEIINPVLKIDNIPILHIFPHSDSDNVLLKSMCDIQYDITNVETKFTDITSPSIKINSNNVSLQNCVIGNLTIECEELNWNNVKVTGKLSLKCQRLIIDGDIHKDTFEKISKLNIPYLTRTII
jgi:hypothetical protein